MTGADGLAIVGRRAFGDDMDDLPLYPRGAP
jgi:hypothetical protein